MSGLARRIHEACHLTGEFVLRSGATSHEYFDKYLFEAQPALLADVADELVALVPDGVDAIAGLELGGIPLATALSARTGIPTRFVRKQAKPYGTRRLAEGGEVAGQRLVVVEDVVTSGGQLLESCRELAARGAGIVRTICVIDRQSGGGENLRREGFELVALFTADDLREAADVRR
ncbi:MAG: orotate phosphoribosyltransferase [Nitriliruptorales bacterium]